MGEGRDVHENEQVESNLCIEHELELGDVLVEGLQLDLVFLSFNN